MAVSNTEGDLSIDPAVSCKLCLTEQTLSDMFELKQCGCSFCTACMKQYIQVMVREGTVLALTCPDASCLKQGTLEAFEVQKLVDQKLYDRYCKLKFEREVDLDPRRTWCPQAGCETICHVCSRDPYQASPVKCPKCGLNFCSRCKLKWHTDLSCDEFVKSGAGASLDLGIPFQADEDAIVKRCPQCHLPIERDEGCAQMMCKRCRHVFCWYCLASLDDDFLLRHYDKGPCRKKLGHSRASVIWYRTQVVGLFAGFGILLLVASPFLLLAAPCLLCGKCMTSKACKSCCSDEVPDNNVEL
ncbi:putative E3 ubiquitin-protein ligase RNF144A-A [Branchiostoma floridae x Branchiostoma japonicum]|uniref:E3 ubiquitin-protein ligase RNF144B n=1 Tax=Branchiostoma floridae TaxID=7739 RepID=C3Y170_BRAFL|eukprot:XP_002609600.1 hypothetical protein BRAFLDRAFT_125022 [Branchiostoma floridae]